MLNVVSYSVIGWPAGQKLLPCSNTQERTMRKFHSIAALCGDGLRPELQALFDRLAIDPRSELFVRDDGMVQAGPDPASERVLASIAPLTKKMPESKWQAALQTVRSGSQPGVKSGTPKNQVAGLSAPATGPIAASDLSSAIRSPDP